MPPDLRDTLLTLARTPVLLVACDYDGTLAEIVADPASARPDARAWAALRDLASAPWTTAAIISGRSLRDLEALLGPAGEEWRVGSHGAEWRDPLPPPDAPFRAHLEQLASIVRSVAQEHPGLTCETKPAGVALHYRTAAPDVAGPAVERASSLAAGVPGVSVRHGSMVAEFVLTRADKGEAVRRARRACGATAVIFVGDDLTDEDALRSLEAGDLGVKVGDQPSVAACRVTGVSDVAALLADLASARREWARTRGITRLERCALLSDQRTAAIVSPGARVSWLCLPRLDSASIFADLVGGESAGYFSIEPAGGGEPASIGYDGDSFVLETRWPALRVTDYLDAALGRAFQKAGRSDLIRAVEGTAPARVRFAPRLDFGRTGTRLRERPDGLDVEGSNDPIALLAPGVRWTIIREGQHDTAEALIEPGAMPAVLELRYGTTNLRPALQPEAVRRENNRSFWAGWARALRAPSIAPAMVRRSALAIKALCYGPSGAIAAAATTSLPEQVGGVRNWDYRFCWPRDAAMAAAALLKLGNTGHAHKLLDWMLDVIDRCEVPERLAPIYTLTGGSLPSEADLSHLRGYADSRPVRIGNAAAQQVQLDVFGPITHLAALLAEHGAPIAPDHWRLVRAMVRAVEARWREPDHGIWEVRLERRHHVHTKVMCWHTVHRALVVDEAVSGARNPEWQALADRIRDDVLTHGWNPRANAFTAAYGLDDADAAALAVGLTGLLEPTDPRFASTVAYVERHLANPRTVRRYVADDGLPGDEGGMHICTGWLIEALALMGRVDEARQRFDALLALVGPTGLLSEQFDSRHGLHVGNFPQAYSHLAVINAAVTLDSAGRRP